MDFPIKWSKDILCLTVINGAHRSSHFYIQGGGLIGFSLRCGLWCSWNNPVICSLEGCIGVYYSLLYNTRLMMQNLTIFGLRKAFFFTKSLASLFDIVYTLPHFLLSGLC